MIELFVDSGVVASDVVLITQMHQCTQTEFDLHGVDDISKYEMYMLRKMHDLFPTVAI